MRVMTIKQVSTWSNSNQHPVSKCRSFNIEILLTTELYFWCLCPCLIGQLVYFYQIKFCWVIRKPKSPKWWQKWVQTPKLALTHLLFTTELYFWCHWENLLQTYKEGKTLGDISSLQIEQTIDSYNLFFHRFEVVSKTSELLMQGAMHNELRLFPHTFFQTRNIFKRHKASFVTIADHLTCSSKASREAAKDSKPS